MLVLLAVFFDFLVASFFHSWLARAVVAYLLAQIALPDEEGAGFSLGCSSVAFLITDFAVHGIFGTGFLFLIPMFLLLKRLKVILVHGSTWLVSIGFVMYFLYESLLFPSGVTVWQILINLVLGYLILLGLRGSRAPLGNTGGGRKVWTPNRKDAS